MQTVYVLQLFTGAACTGVYSTRALAIEAYYAHCRLYECEPGGASVCGTMTNFNDTKGGEIEGAYITPIILDAVLEIA